MSKAASGALLTAWAVDVGIVAYRDYSQEHRPPLPSEIAATVVVFGGLSMLSESETAAGFAAALGWGIVIAGLLRVLPSMFPGQSAQAPPPTAKAQ